MLKTKLFPFQQEDLQKMEGFHGRVLLANDPGLGKSITTLAYLDRHPELKPAVIICPAGLKWNWQGEVNTHLGWKSNILEGLTPRWKGSKKAPIWIINYEILGEWLPFLKTLEPGLVIADECQAIRNLKTKRTRNVRKLCSGVDHILALSGTPLTNRPAELFSVLNLLRPDLYPSFFSYATDFCKLQRKPWGMDYSGARNLKQLHRETTSELMIRRRKEDVLDLPEKVREMVYLPLDDPEDYRMAEREYARWLRKKQPSKANSALRMEEATKLGELKRLAARRKILAAYDWIDSLLESTDEKLIIFGIHRKILQAVHASYPDISVLVNGDVTGRKRQIAYDQFNQDPRTRLLVGNTQAAGVGWSCSSASIVAFLEFPWVPADITQGEDRTRGIGRGIVGRSTTVYFLLGMNTIETDLCSYLSKKQKIIDRVLDGGVMEDSLDLEELLNQGVLERTGGG